MPRYVILHHDWPVPHYDLMLEVDGTLRTWRLDRLPSSPAERIDDHRLAYLEYEGPVSGARGSVRRIESGTYECIEDGFRTVVRLQGPRTRILLIQNNHATEIDGVSGV